MKKFLAVAIAISATTVHAQQVATYYGGKFHGRKTASGEIFNQNAMTCASNKHKFGTRLKVTNVANGKSVVCRVNDRGGFGKYGIALDLSKGAFAKIAPLSQGRARVTIELANDADVADNKDTNLVADDAPVASQVDEALSKIAAVTTTRTVKVVLANPTND